jgi:hypothetical protein
MGSVVLTLMLGWYYLKTGILMKMEGDTGKA